MSDSAARRAKHKAWRDANKEHVAERGKAWRAANPDKVKAANKKWYAANGATVVAWRQTNRDKHSEYTRRCRLRNHARYLWRNLHKRAVENGVVFHLTYEHIKRMLEATPVCPVLGIQLRPGTRNDRDNSPSIDRFDPSKGYVPDNVAVISFRANMIKNNATLDEIKKVAAWMQKIHYEQETSGEFE